MKHAEIPSLGSVTLTTGNGRLYWRATKPLEGDRLGIDFLSNLSEDCVFYDIGANAGLFSLFAANICSKKGAAFSDRGWKSLEKPRIVAVEPSAENFATLVRNVKLNHRTDEILPLNFAVSTQVAVVPLFMRSDMAGSALHKINEVNPLNVTRYGSFPLIHELVLAAPMEWLINAFNLPSPTCIKVDIDGGDLLALQTFGSHLAGVTDIFMETGSTGLSDDAPLLEFLAKECFAVHERSNNDSWLKRSQ